MVRVSRYANTDQVDNRLGLRTHALQKSSAWPFRLLAQLM
jgi:hypothetical protein